MGGGLLFYLCVLLVVALLFLGFVTFAPWCVELLWFCVVVLAALCLILVCGVVLWYVGYGVFK